MLNTFLFMTHPLRNSSVLVLRSGASPLAEHRLVGYLVF
uniref:Uncharacterized protein n=1 Tax=Myoviridae sp. ctk251 TaxID=2826689 RepID=A0A8S5MSK1_9CAUD|nr:MAG TPA: hypothetical protein [Myoviridae sp. ctk251]